MLRLLLREVEESVWTCALSVQVVLAANAKESSYLSNNFYFMAGFDSYKTGTKETQFRYTVHYKICEVCFTIDASILKSWRSKLGFFSTAFQTLKKDNLKLRTIRFCIANKTKALT